jgi:hypothetical protein
MNAATKTGNVIAAKAPSSSQPPMERSGALRSAQTESRSHSLHGHAYKNAPRRRPNWTKLVEISED